MNDPITINFGAPATDPQAQAAQATAWFQAQVPRLYANGFVAGYTNSDMNLVMLLNGSPAAIVNLSFTCAKTLSQELMKTIKILEDRIGSPIPTMNDLAENSLKKDNPEEG